MHAPTAVHNHLWPATGSHPKQAVGLLVIIPETWQKKAQCIILRAMAIPAVSKVAHEQSRSTVRKVHNSKGP